MTLFEGNGFALVVHGRLPAVVSSSSLPSEGGTGSGLQAF